MGDEEVIKRRLLIDGDGTGDDRRLNVLLEAFVKWCNSDENTDDQMVHDRLQAQLAQVSFAAVKSEYANKMIEEELKNYEALSNSIEGKIELAKAEIEASKEDFILAKKIRKNRMEYDVLAKVINAQPDRKDTTKQLEALNTELKELEDEKLKLERKLKTRQNDFFVLMRSIKELQGKLDESSDEEAPEDEDEKMSIDDKDDIIEI